MDRKCINMDNTYFWFKTVADWIEYHPLPPIPYADFTTSDRFYNPPAPHLEITFSMAADCPDLRIGDRTVYFPANHVSLHNVHFGNYSSRVKNSRGWCLFFDVTGIRELAKLTQKPFFISMPVSNPQRLAIAFETVANRCRLPGHIHPGYLSGTLAYDPKDERHCTAARQLHLKAAILDLFAVLLENAQGLQTAGPPEILQFIRLGIEFITRNYANPKLTLADIAEAVHLSDDYFGLIFRRHVGTTPMRYLKTVRIQQAKLLLAQTRLSVGDIAQKIGFADPLHFSRVFRQETRRSPRDYRNRNV